MNINNMSDLLRLPMPIQATLFKEGEFVGTGEAVLRGPFDENSFLSKSGDIAEGVPHTGEMMKLQGINVMLHLIDFRPYLRPFEKNKRRHFHFHFECSFPSPPLLSC